MLPSKPQGSHSKRPEADEHEQDDEAGGFGRPDAGQDDGEADCHQHGLRDRGAGSVHGASADGSARAANPLAMLPPVRPASRAKRLWPISMKWPVVAA